MSNQDNQRTKQAPGRSGDGGDTGSGRHRTPLHGVMLILSALERGIEIGMDGSYIRLFRAGDVVRLPAGYFRLDEDRILQRLPGAQAPASRSGESIYVDNGLTINGLLKQSQLLSEEALAKIACSTQSSWTASADQAFAGNVAQRTGRVVQLFGRNSQETERR